jgi:probable rRNA maturation factor
MEKTLKIIGKSKIINLTDLASATHKTLKQKDAIYCELSFVSKKAIRELNRDFRGVDKVTDVLSFPSFDSLKDGAIRAEDYPYDLDEEGKLLIGSIAVCEKRAKEQAEEYGHSFERELNYLLVHGIMHCLGYDHETDEEKSEMREHEEIVLEKAGIPRTL